MIAMNKDKSVAMWLFTGAAFIFLMILLGGITRLTGSGLSIVEWNLIGGVIPPLTTEEWNEAFRKYQAFPEYKKLNHAMDLSGFKSIFFWEYVHRLTGRLIGVIFILPYLFFWIKGKLNRRVRQRLNVILLLGIAQGVMGWVMVKSGLADNPNVSHYRLAIHFVLALTLLGLVLLTAFQMWPGEDDYLSVKDRRFRFFFRFLLGAAMLQLVYGAFVAGLKAGHAYNTFPAMNGQWFPDGIRSNAPLYIDCIENGVTVQFIHRWLGILLFSGTFLLWLYAHKAGTADRKQMLILLMLISLQVLWGIITLVGKVPLGIALLHQATGVLVFLYLFLLAFRGRTGIKNAI